MNIPTAALILVVITMIAVSVFLLLELRKKFGFMNRFVQDSKQLLSYDYVGGKNTMAQVVIIWDKPFKVLIGFELALFGIKGFDYYGYAESGKQADGHHTIVIETYLGKGAAIFQFLFNQSFKEEHGPLVKVVPKWTHQPTVTYPPHWFQKL